LYYALEEIIRKPGTWLFLAVFGIGNTLILIGIKSIIYKVFLSINTGMPIVLPSYLQPYSLIVAVIAIITGIFLLIPQKGYIIRIYQGTTPAPPFHNWPGLFQDGIRLFVINSVYWIAPAFLCFWTVVIPCLQYVSKQTVPLSPQITGVTLDTQIILDVALGGIVLTGIVHIICMIFSVIGVIRYSRTGSIRSAFDVFLIIRIISTIGWKKYLLSLFYLAMLDSSIQPFIRMISLGLAVVGSLILTTQLGDGVAVIQFFLTSIFDVLIMVVIARYLTILYDTWTDQAGIQALS